MSGVQSRSAAERGLRFVSVGWLIVVLSKRRMTGSRAEALSQLRIEAAMRVEAFDHEL